MRSATIETPAPIAGATARVPSEPLATWTATVAAVLVAAAVAGWVMFDNLGADRMWGDEATYALVVDRMLATGDWLHPTTDGVRPYFDKPPLYMWLTALTSPLFDDALDMTRYRVWSAAMGVACVAATVVLAATWFDDVVGLIAGLLLALNGRFLYQHGVRHGGLDGGLVLGVLLAALAYTAWFHGRLRGACAWPLVGAACGLASWFKPLAGAPLLPLLLAHALAFDRRARWPAKALGAVAALAVCLAAVAPWYAYAYREHGAAFTGAFFGKNLAERITVGVSPRHVQGWDFYWTAIADASGPFWWYWLALPALAVLAWRRRRVDAAAVGLLWLVGVGWVALFSLSPSKFVHYAYPAFPFVAAAIAAAGVWVARRALAAPAARGWRLDRAASLATAAVFGLVAARTVYEVTPDRQTVYRPWAIYRALASAVSSGAMPLVGFALPDRFDDNNTNLYVGKMPAPRPVTSVAALAAAVAGGEPFLLLWHKPGGDLPADVRAALAAAADERFSADADDLSIFAVNAHRVLSPMASAGEQTAAIRWPHGTGLPARLEVVPPVPGPATLLLTIEWDAADRPPGRISWRVTQPTRGRAGNGMAAAPDRQTIAVPLTFRAVAVGTPQAVTVDVRAEGGARHGQPVGGRVVDATIVYAPSVTGPRQRGP